MFRLVWFSLGLAAAAATVALAAAWVVLAGANGFSAKEMPPAAERWLARQARSFAMPAAYRNLTNPVPNTPEVLAEARAHWADHCAACHANDGSGDTEMGRSLYPPAPNMRQTATQSLTDGELFSVIQYGVRLTGMPAWGSSHGSEEDSWKLVRFVRHLPQLTSVEKAEMEKLNPKGPEDRDEEEQEEKFLKGETVDVPNAQHHHRD
jgi:mono/diheme cytochrome c family protein